MTEEVVRVLSFDPAITLAGWAVSDYKLPTGTLVVHRYGDISPSKAVSHADMRPKIEQYGRRIIALATLRDMVTNLVEEYKPDFVVLEDAFVSSRFPNAFISLIQWISTVEMLVYQKYNKPVYRIPAKSAKLATSGFGGSGKTNIQNAVLSNERIIFKQKRQSPILNEHEADAVSIAYAFCVNVLPGLLSKESVLLQQ